MYPKTKEVKRNGGFRRNYCKDKPCMKQSTYGAIFILSLFTMAFFIETAPIISAVSLAVMVVCFFKGELWEIKEERSERNDVRAGK